MTSSARWTRGTVASWNNDGWGVLDSPDTPGGCFALWAHIASDEVRDLRVGQAVQFSYEQADQDDYPFRATYITLDPT